ncbi:hypothetical protein B0T18DRAFT_115720 [Schizothecium vesticola]|uniref:Uncharacterized protein n=1 Tax=Schizothecium vesticola TaxID=314040 RepID=A0AA40F240_9PEZI|nr:hypothetical protein B0T18DRAFT_115720 [Schizothecium vesticola]
MADPRAPCVVIEGAVVSCEMPISSHCASIWPLDALINNLPPFSRARLACRAGRATLRLLSCAPRRGVDHLLSRCSRASRTMLDEDIGGGRYQGARRSTFRMGVLSPSRVMAVQKAHGERPEPDCWGERGVESIMVLRNVEAIQLVGSRKSPGIREARH